MEDHEELSTPWEADVSASTTAPPGGFFSADRHHARLAQSGWGENGGVKEAWNASEAMVFESIVTESTDEAMIEARALLTHWMSNAETKNSAGDDASTTFRTRLREADANDLEERLCAATQRGQIREIVQDAVQDGVVKSVHIDTTRLHPDSRTTIAARQALARERRESTRRIRAEELEAKAALKQQKLVEGLQRKTVGRTRARGSGVLGEDSWKMDLAVRAARAAIEGEMERKKALRLGKQHKGLRQCRESVVDEEYRRILEDEAYGRYDNIEPSKLPTTTSAQQTTKVPHPVSPSEAFDRALKFEEDKKEKLQRERRLEFIEAGYQSAEKMYAIWRLKTLQARISAWKNAVLQEKEVLDRFQKMETRKLDVAAMAPGSKVPTVTAVGTCSVFINKSYHTDAFTCRAAAELAQQLKRAQETALQALRFQRATILSKVFVGWMGWARTEREERKLRVRHEQRAARMKEMLAKLEEKQKIEARQQELEALEAKRALEERTARDVQLITEMELRQKERQERRQALAATRAAAEQARVEEAHMAELAAAAASQAEKQALRDERKRLEAAAEATRARQQAIRDAVEGFRGKWIMKMTLKAWCDRRTHDTVLATRMWEARWMKVWVRAWRAREQNREDNACAVWKARTHKDVWKNWITNRELHRKSERAAQSLSRYNFLRSVLRVWRSTFSVASGHRIARDAVMCERADVLARKLVPKRVIRTWREFVAEEKERKWRELRKQMLRDRVKEMLQYSSFGSKLEIETIRGQDPVEEDAEQYDALLPAASYSSLAIASAAE
ncbi:hypothetical protein HKX48_005875 [Thoreauomyces humboldtii]|nr:hypothetical protein HKX48_005875 [Thoreauomyces humboldtii]